MRVNLRRGERERERDGKGGGGERERERERERLIEQKILFMLHQFLHSANVSEMSGGLDVFM